MPAATTFADTPARHVLPAGTRLWRVHGDDIGPADRRPAIVHAAPDSATALAERLLKGTRFANGTRTVEPRALAGQRLSAVITTTDLVVARLAAPGDPAVVRRRIAWAQGATWPSTVDLPRPAVALFSDRCPDGVLRAAPGPAIRLDDPVGAAMVTEILTPYRTRVDTPDGAPLVFINYRGADERMTAVLLDEELRIRLGAPAVFLDDRSIPPGVDFTVELLDKVRHCAVLLVVIGRHWEKVYDRDGRLLDRDHDWVRMEIAEAHRHGKLVIPILVGARDDLNAESLPEDIGYLARRQYRHLARGYPRQHVADLADGIIRDSPALAAAYAKRS
jgi:hypothetical protein